MPFYVLQPTSILNPDPTITFYDQIDPMQSVTLTGHGTNSIFITPGVDDMEERSCRWFGFQSPVIVGVVRSINIKASYFASGSVNNLTFADYIIQYSLDNGANWITSVQLTGNFSQGADISHSIPINQNISQVLFRDYMGAAIFTSDPASVQAFLSNIRVEIDVLERTGIKVMM